MADTAPPYLCTRKISLITGYANNHYAPTDQPGQWADGLSIECEHTTVEHNQVVDASDAGIVVFRAGFTVAQESQVYSNTVLNAGNPAWLAFGANGLWSDPGFPYDFRGTRFTDNLFWTGPTAHLDIAVVMGSKEWYPAGGLGRGAAFIANTTGSQGIRTNIPIAVSGMTETVICANTLNYEIVKTIYCSVPPNPAEKPILVSESAGWGSLVTSTECPVLPLYDDITLTACIGHIPFPEVFLPVLYKSGGQGELRWPSLLEGYPPPMPPEMPALPSYPQP